METKKNIEYIPEFHKSFRHPRYWGAWLGVAAIAGIALTPASFRDPILANSDGSPEDWEKLPSQSIDQFILCFPERSEAEREAIVDDMYATAPQAMVMMAELAIRGPEKIQNRVDWQGLEIIEEMRRNDEKVIFLVPHGWGVDIPAMLMASQGQKMAAMFHNQGNPVFDYVWNTVRRRFGGRLHARNDGIKPFIQSVRQGYWGYYLPDQDHGPEHSEFVDFFATYKATLPAIGRLMKVCHARVVPLFPYTMGERTA
jgi:lauroyl-KDO2-lipid IV(A) myristoyltransferase